jgi:hypothetical protein
MKTLLVLLACLVPAQDAWWNGGWTFRRRIAIKNNLEGDLKAGYPVQIEIDAEYLGIQEKANRDFSDLVVVHGGKRIPSAILPGRSAACRVIAFRTAADLPGGARDESYAFYYGNPAAPPEADARGSIFEFYEDFSDPKTLARHFSVDPELTASVQDGALVVREVAAGRTEMTPARMVLKDIPPLGGFSLTFDVEVDSPMAVAPGIAVTIDLKEPGLDPKESSKKVDVLIENLGDLDWEAREKATRELIKLGRPAVARLVEASRSDDAEIKWRAEHVLREIREHSPSPTIVAGVMGADPTVGPVALLSRVGGSRTRSRYATSWPVRLRVTILRDSDGEITLLWNNGKPQTGHLEGDLREISFGIWKGSAAPLGRIRLTHVILARHVDDQARPTHTVQFEEKRP